MTILFPVKIFAEGSLSDPIDLLRAGRWTEIQRYFKSNRASSETHRFILGRAAQEKLVKIPPSPKALAEPLHEATAIYLSILGLTCGLGSEDELSECIATLGPESRTGQVQRLAILKLSQLLRATGWNTARLNLLGKSSLGEADPLTGAIYTELLEVMLARNMKVEAMTLASRMGAIASNRTHFYRARAFIRGGKRDDGWNLYLLAAARSQDNLPLLRSIFQDLKFYFPQAFRPGTDQHSMHRSLLMFHEYLTPQERQAFTQAWPADRLLATTGPTTALGDGLHLIAQGDMKSFNDLTQRTYTAVSRDPGILYWWASRLIQTRRYADVVSLLDKFDHVKKENAPIWRLELTVLPLMGNRDKTFREILAYLSVFDSDLEVHDTLIEWLIGDNDRNIKWAPEPYWELARGTLPPGTANGRFVYWLRRFYKSQNREDKAQEIADRFYELAPGSYYARVFWDEQKPGGDFRNDWRNVRDRSTYLRWIGKYGGSQEAVRFLASRNVSNYYDPRALDLWSRLQAIQYSIPESVITMWKLGEFALGQEFFDYHFKDKFSKREMFLRRVMLGMKSGHLDQSVWHLRQVAREENIPEDPYSLPPEFLRSLYPRPYLRQVRGSASEYGIPEEMVYALMRQESMFRETAVSRSGALGLMQVMPATGRWLSGKMQIKNPDLLEPAVSIRMGSKFFADLLGQYNSDFRWASIAYNGGPGSLSRWKQQFYHGDFNLFLENIPSRESRNYCRVTFQNYMHYRTTYALYP
ncbi:MAG: lytic transglycosylase domain-containing protein [Spirochaetia bacterium]|nr:lytic transglycosylase domain-containing protein [Spirochaetia bacterium]